MLHKLKVLCNKYKYRTRRQIAREEIEAWWKEQRQPRIFSYAPPTPVKVIGGKLDYAFGSGVKSAVVENGEAASELKVDGPKAQYTTIELAIDIGPHDTDPTWLIYNLYHDEVRQGDLLYGENSFDIAHYGRETRQTLYRRDGKQPTLSSKVFKRQPDKELLSKGCIYYSETLPRLEPCNNTDSRLVRLVWLPVDLFTITHSGKIYVYTGETRRPKKGDRYRNGGMVVEAGQDHNDPGDMPQAIYRLKDEERMVVIYHKSNRDWFKERGNGSTADKTNAHHYKLGEAQAIIKKYSGCFPNDRYEIQDIA